jgi:S1-C subfamily serine protease
VGQRVYALRNPFGLEHTLTTGIVSAVGRPMTTGDGYMMKDLIQTDAAINPGNSGGPLLNSSGEMIRINTMILSPAGGSIGIGFAVPVSTALRVVPDLLEHGRVMRGWTDIVPVPIFPILERLGGPSTSRGIIVSQRQAGQPRVRRRPARRHPRGLARLLEPHDLRRRRHHRRDERTTRGDAR